MRRILFFRDLGPKKGIKYTRQHIDRLVKKKRFPPPFKPNGGEHGENGWFEDIIDDHLEACAAKSTKAQPKTEHHVR